MTKFIYGESKGLHLEMVNFKSSWSYTGEINPNLYTYAKDDETHISSF